MIENIAALFRTLPWTAGVYAVYITNGWHTGFEGRYNAQGQWVMAAVTYCGYKVNDDANAPKQHYYA